MNLLLKYNKITLAGPNLQLLSLKIIKERIVVLKK